MKEREDRVGEFKVGSTQGPARSERRDDVLARSSLAFRIRPDETRATFKRGRRLLDSCSRGLPRPSAPSPRVTVLHG